MTFPQAFVTRFFQLINNRQLTEARRELQRLKEKMQKTEWNHGYYRALYGMLLARKANGNQYAFLSNIDQDNRPAMLQHKKEFLRQIQSRFHDDFDRGYFSAWHDYTRLLVKKAEGTQRRQDLEAQTSIIQYAETTQKL
jgi:hypothetical protein